MSKNNLKNEGVYQALDTYKKILLKHIENNQEISTRESQIADSDVNSNLSSNQKFNHEETLYNEELMLERAVERAKDIDKSISYKTTMDNLEIEKIKQRNRTSEILNDCLTDINKTEKEKQPVRNKIANFILSLLKIQLVFLGTIIIVLMLSIIFKGLTNVQIIEIMFQYLTKLTFYTIVETFALLAYVVRYLFKDTIKPKYDFLKLVLYEQEDKKDESRKNNSK